MNDTIDIEIMALQQLVEALEKLDHAARLRILRWAMARYEAALPVDANEPHEQDGAA